MKNLVVLWALLFCGSFLSAQTSMTLDNAILDSVHFFAPKIPAGSTIAVINIEAETKNLSDFIVEELLAAFGNTGSIKVVERSRLEMLEAELNFNMSGSVSDETAQGIGRMTGAQVLFSGSIAQYRDMYRMRVQGIFVETAEIIGIRTIDIRYDPTLSGLLGRINPADQWKYQWLYAGASFGYTATVSKSFPNPGGRYTFDNGEFTFVNYGYDFDIPFGYGIYLMVQPFDLFGITVDFGGTMYDGPMISIFPTLTIRPGKFEVDVFLGAGYPVIPSSWSIGAILGGVRAGRNIGPGVLFAEVRPIVSMGYGYSAFFINATLGYQIGFLPRKK